MRKLRNAREVIFKPKDLSTRLTGQGINILLFDDGLVNNNHYAGTLNNISFNDTTNNESDHASRVTSVCAGMQMADNEALHLGIAFAANLFIVQYSSIFPNRYVEAIRHINKIHGHILISAHAYSGKDSYHINKLAKNAFEEFAASSQEVSHLVIAACGHDGNTHVRFPASLPSVLSVGVHDEELRPTKYCGASLEHRKPELMIPDYDYLARLPDGNMGQINGTSAAAGIIAGLAALWCEKLKEVNIYPDAQLLKAILLATGKLSNVSYSRIATASIELMDDAPIYIKKLTFENNKTFKFDIAISKAQQISYAVVTKTHLNKIVNAEPLIHVRLEIDGQLVEHNSDYGYLLSNFEAQSQTILTLLLTVENNLSEGYLVMTGIKHINDVQPHINAPKSNKKKPLTIVGISASHDSSACIMQDGEIKAAIQLERLTRVKREGYGYLHSDKAIQYCLDALGITKKEVDYFAFNSQPLIPEYYGLSQPTHDHDFSSFEPFDKNCLYISHHLAHAFSTFFASPFNDSLVYVADGSGGSTIGRDDLILSGTELKDYLENEITEKPLLHVESAYLFTERDYQLVDRKYADSFNVRCGSSSLGEVYAAVSQYIFGSWQDGGKLMGLAPYGNASDYGPSLLKEDKNGLLKFISTWKNSHRALVNKNDPMHYKHLAARIQTDFETALLQRMQLIREKCSQSDNFSYAGGIALNCVANEKIINTSGFNNYYVFPASSDSGISIGAAAAAHYHLTGSTKGQGVPHVFLGYQYKKRDYANAINLYKDFIKTTSITDAQIAARLAKGEIFGLFEGSSEFGPRALGHRSIIADSRSKATWKFINRWIKFREDFRPFAPAVPVELAEKFFTTSIPSPYMLRAVNVREEFREKLGAVTHLNNTARIQTVDKTVLPKFHNILTEFGAITDIPVLVNTSLNVRGQPIVETPEQAIELLLCTHLSGMIFEDTLVTLAFDVSTELSTNSILALAPDINMNSESNEINHRQQLKTDYRRKTLSLEDWQYQILFYLRKRVSFEQIKSFAQQHNIKQDIWLPWLKNLIKLRYVYQINP